MARQQAEASRRRQHERDDRWIAYMLIAYMLVGGVLGSIAVTLVMAR